MTNNKQLAEQTECKHTNTRFSGRDGILCNECQCFMTDSFEDWGIAKNMWFKSRNHAEFYKKNGVLPYEL